MFNHTTHVDKRGYWRSGCRIGVLLVFAGSLFGLVACNKWVADPSSPSEAILPSVEFPIRFEEASCPFRLPAGQVEGRTVECGYLVVPEDRSDPGDRIVRLAVAIFHPPNGPIEPDPIVYLTGGPGARTLELLYLAFDRVFAPLFAAYRDLILFDQRGVGFSQPALDCPKAYDLGLELLDNELNGKQLTDEESGELFEEAYQSCAQDLRAVADLSDYNTASSAADVNDLRIALGYEQVNLLGGSYGTRLALGVMRDYPAGIRSVVLDSVYPPDVDIYLETPANLDRSLDLLFATCAADPACNSAYPNLSQVFFEAVTHLEEAPVALVITNPLDGESHDLLLTGDTLLGYVFQLLYETEVLPILPQLIYEVNKGDFATLIRIYGRLIAQSQLSSRGMMLSVQCNEEIAFSTPEQFNAVLLDYPELAAFLKTSLLGEFAYHACTFWGAGRAESTENEPVISDIPTLVLQGEFDPITPPAWGQHAAETLENSYYYLFPGVGHGASVVECPRAMLIDFIEVPSTAPQDTCMEGMSEISFILPGAEIQTIEMQPFISDEKGLQGVAPAGWTEAGPGTFTRRSTALDETALILDAAPLTADALFGRLARQMGLDPGLKRIAQLELGHFSWDLYAFDYRGLVIDLALAEGDGRAYMALLASEPDEHDALYEPVFLAAVESLRPLNSKED